MDDPQKPQLQLAVSPSGLQVGDGGQDGAWRFENPSRTPGPNPMDGFDLRDPESSLTLYPPISLPGKGFRVQFSFVMLPEPGDFRRYNLIEGLLPTSGGAVYFWVGVRKDRELASTILTARDAWDGPATAPDCVRPGTCHDVIACYDGERELGISLDGGPFARRNVGPAKGRAINEEATPAIYVGRWPSSTKHHQFAGFVFDIQISTYAGDDAGRR